MAKYNDYGFSNTLGSPEQDKAIDAAYGLGVQWARANVGFTRFPRFIVYEGQNFTLVSQASLFAKEFKKGVRATK